MIATADFSQQNPTPTVLYRDFFGSLEDLHINATSGVMAWIDGMSHSAVYGKSLQSNLNILTANEQVKLFFFFFFCLSCLC